MAHASFELAEFPPAEQAYVQVLGLTPADDARDLGEGCRRFRLIATGSFGLSEGRTVACAAPDGTWTLSPETRLGQR